MDFVEQGRVGVHAEAEPGVFVCRFFVFDELDFTAEYAGGFAVLVFVGGVGAPVYGDLVPDTEVEVDHGRCNLFDGVFGARRLDVVRDGKPRFAAREIVHGGVGLQPLCVLPRQGDGGANVVVFLCGGGACRRLRRFVGGKGCRRRVGGILHGGEVARVEAVGAAVGHQPVGELGQPHNFVFVATRNVISHHSVLLVSCSFLTPYVISTVDITVLSMPWNAGTDVACASRYLSLFSLKPILDVSEMPVELPERSVELPEIVVERPETPVDRPEIIVELPVRSVDRPETVVELPVRSVHGS